MKTQSKIVFVSNTTWSGDYMKAVNHLAGNLAERNDVLYVDHGHSIKDLVRKLLESDFKYVARMLGFSRRCISVRYKKNTLQHLVLPPLLPINWIQNKSIYEVLNRLNARISKGFITGAMNKINESKAQVIYAFNPTVANELIELIPARTNTYYCYDEISEAKWCSAHGTESEKDLLKKVELTVVTSKKLLETKGSLHPNTHLVPNGVDFELFSKHTPSTRNRKKKVIGYVGSVDQRLNFDLIERSIVNIPDAEFLFVGRIVDQELCKRLSKYINVRFTGAVAPDSIPDYLQQMTVATIPFTYSDFNRSIYPLKINEYLAAGLPVISTDFGDLSDFNSVIDVAQDHKDYVNKLEYLIHRNEDPSLVSVRQRLAEKNNWSNRVNMLEGILR
jgi:glycosyltransferase involved in cell wall biosynthesis